MTTWFKKPDRHKVTVMAPGVEGRGEAGGSWPTDRSGEVDFCLAGDRWKSAALDVESDTSSPLQSDHFYLGVHLRLELKAGGGRKEGQATRHDFRASLHEPGGGEDSGRRLGHDERGGN